MNRSGGAYVTPAILDDRWMVRVSIGALATEHAHVEALWALLRREAEGAHAGLTAAAAGAGESSGR